MSRPYGSRWAVGGRHLALPVCWLLAAAPAGATVVRRPVEVRIAGPPRAAEPGRAFAGILEVVATDDVDVQGLTIDPGRSWRLSQGAVPASLHLGRGETRRIPFTLITDDPAEPLHLEYQVDGEIVRKALDLSPEAVDRQRWGKLTPIEDPGVLQALQASIDVTAPRAEAAPAPPERPFDEQALGTGSASEEDDRVLLPASRDVRVVGFFTYRRMNDGAAVGVDGAVARVYDEDTGPDELLATQVLGPDGRLDVTFNWDPCFGCDGTPDVYVEFELDNAEIDVHDDSLFEWDYTFETGVWPDYGGSLLDIGAQTPGDAALFPACHIMTNATRAWRFADAMGRDTPKVGYQWPDDDGCGACYDDGLEEIYIDTSRGWNENTIVHEFGHHFVNTFAVITPPDYCPSIYCNSPTCGHCIWCQETDHDAFNEGFADYYQDVVMRTSITNPVTQPRGYEVLQPCTDSGANAIHDPLRTEGIFAALLHDVEDHFNENDLTQPKGSDKLTLGWDEIFWLVDFYAPTTPQAFIDRFLENYAGLKEPFWATAANTGYQTDFAPPGKVTNIASDHTLYSNSDTRPNIKWSWNRAPDDASGIQGYSIWVQQGILPGMPDATIDAFDVTEFTSGPHPPGWYYISIRAIDNNGVWSDTYETAGPYGIRPADPGNLAVQTPSNWDYLAVTARHVPDATQFSTLAPAILDGQGGPSYLSAIYKNNGEQVTVVDQWWVDFYVDQYPIAYNHHLGYLNPGIYDYVLNQPVTITGGRHVLGVRLDDSDFMSEPNELDNQWARQWGWTAPWVGLGAAAAYPSPPPPYQGTQWITDGSPFYQNCRGFRAQDEVLNFPSNMWTAVTLHASDAADYDLSVFSPSTAPTTAFTTPFSGSYRGSGATDIYLFNSWQYFGYPIPLDYGVTNYSGGIPGQNAFYLQKVTSQNLNFPGGNLDILGTDEVLKLYQYYAPSGNVWARVQVTDPSLGQVYLTLVPQAFTNGPLSNAGTTVVSDAATGWAAIDELQAGYQCLAVWRDPTMGTSPLGLLVSIQATPSDLALQTPPGWAAPLVPRPAADGAPGLVPAPAFLLGDVPQTYLNYAIANAGAVSPPAVAAPTTFYADGAVLATDAPAYPPPGSTTYRNLSTPVQFRGGRHVLGIHLDSTDAIGEMSEANNRSAGQWVWRPSTLSFDLVQARTVPPARFAGWELMPAGSPLWFNMDGLRTPSMSPDAAGDGWKLAAFALPDAGGDFDLKLFEAAPDAATGFDIQLASSEWGADQPDFVIADFRVTSPRQFDVGFGAPVVLPGGALVEFRRSKSLGAVLATAAGLRSANRGDGSTPAVEGTSGGTYGPFTIGAGDLFDLYEVSLPAGTYVVRLIPGAGSVDWGLGVYGPGPAFLSRSDALAGGMGWEAPAGAEERLDLTIAQAGLHGVVVWKNRRLDVNAAGTFTLEFAQQATGVSNGPPVRAVSLIQAVRPNPFASSSQVDVLLARPADVSLHVFNPVGRRLYAASFGRMEPGSHALDWDGRDDQGRPVAAGIYFVKVEAGTESDVRKILRVR